MIKKLTRTVINKLDNKFISILLFFLIFNHNFKICLFNSIVFDEKRINKK